MSAKSNILVANIGSTSFKFRLFEMPSERVLARGGIERIGSSAVRSEREPILILTRVALPVKSNAGVAE